MVLINVIQEEECLYVCFVLCRRTSPHGCVAVDEIKFVNYDDKNWLSVTTLEVGTNYKQTTGLMCLGELGLSTKY